MIGRIRLFLISKSWKLLDYYGATVAQKKNLQNSSTACKVETRRTFAATTKISKQVSSSYSTYARLTCLSMSQYSPETTKFKTVVFLNNKSTMLKKNIKTFWRIFWTMYSTLSRILTEKHSKKRLPKPKLGSSIPTKLWRNLDFPLYPNEYLLYIRSI